MPPKKLIYILNSYSSSDSSHFNHVPALLEALAARGIEVVLVIEKADSIPTFTDTNISVIRIKHRHSLSRFLELFMVITHLRRRGFMRTYVRIAAPAALIAALVYRLFGGQVFFWQSGTTIEFDSAQPMSLKKLKWYVVSSIPNSLARRLVHYFVTGPAYMVDYYSRVGGVKREKIRLLYNDVDIARFIPPVDRVVQKAAFLKAHGLKPDTVILLLVHRFSPVRRIARYLPNCLTHLRAVGLLNRVVVVVVGTGPELPFIQVEVQNLGIAERCLFLGSVPNREIQQMYAVADIFLIRATTKASLAWSWKQWRRGCPLSPPMPVGLVN